MTASTQKFPRDTAGLPAATATEVVELGDGDRFALRIAPVTKRIGDATVRMLAYNGSIPGPTLRVPEGAEVIVDIENEGDLEATVHWHGLRLDNRYDGTHETQEVMPIGGATRRVSRSRTRASTGTTRTSARTTARSWACTATASSFPPTPTTGRPCIASSRSRSTTSSSRTARLPPSAPTRRRTPRWAVSATCCSSPATPSSRSPRAPARSCGCYLTNTANTRVFKVALPGAG